MNHAERAKEFLEEHSSCKDCVYYGVCAEQDAMLGENTIDEIKGVEKHCEYFKPKSRFVEVVRCKDCRHRTLTEEGEFNPEDIVCGYFMTDGMQANDFCSYGENALKEREKE